MKTPLLFALILALALGFMLWRAGSDPEVASPNARISAGKERDVASLVAPKAEPEATRPEQRASVAGGERALAALPPGPALAREAILELSGRVRDDQDLPVQGATVWIAPRGAGFARAARTDAAGAFQLRLAAFRSVLDVLVAVESPQGGVSGIHPVRLDARAPMELDFGLAAVANVAFLLEGGEITLQGLSLGGDESGSFVITFATIDVGGDPVLAAAPRLHRDTEGVRRFTEAFAPSGCPAATALNAPLQTDAVALSNVRGGGQTLRGRIVSGSGVMDLSSVTFRSEEELVPAEGGGTQARISGRVLGRDGEPVADASVALLTAEGGVRERTRSDAEGRYAFEALAAGPVTLVAGGGGHGVARLETELATGERLGFDPVLDRGRELVGALHAEDGTPLSEWIVELVARADGVLWTKRVRTDAEGRFGFANVPSASVELAAFAKDEEARLPRLTRSALVTGGAIEPIVVALSDLLEHTLTVDLRDALGEPLPDAWARLVSRTSGRAVHLGHDSERGLLVAEGLPPGRYLLLLGGPGGLQTEALDIQLAGGTAQSLDGLRLSAPAGLVVSPTESRAGALPALALWRLRDTHRASLGAVKLDALRSAALAPGAYLAEGPGGACAFQLAEDGSVRLVARRSGAEGLSIEAFVHARTPLGDEPAAEEEATAPESEDPPAFPQRRCEVCHTRAGLAAAASDALGAEKAIHEQR